MTSRPPTHVPDALGAQDTADSEPQRWAPRGQTALEAETVGQLGSHGESSLLLPAHLQEGSSARMPLVPGK